MLSMAKLPKRKRPSRHTIDAELAILDESVAKPMTLHNLPKRGRVQRENDTPDRVVPTKILTMSDLPKRTKAMRAIARVAQQQLGKRQTVSAGNRHLGPKKFSDYVRDGAWKGRRCFIIGGGPSIKDVDLNLLRSELTIGINRAYELLDPSILFGVDGQMWGWAEQGKLGAESEQKFNAYRGYKVWMALHKVFPPDFYLVDVDGSSGYRIGRTSRLAFKNNSGYGAINLAAALGANPIYLLGFDMHGDRQGKQKWWHDGYPVDYGENVYKRYIDELGKFAPVLRDAGFEVVNLNPKSALKCFPLGDYKKIVAKKPVVPEGAIMSMEKPGFITAITPTGDRPLAFALCKHWMEMQTVKPDQWIIVDDGKVPMKPPVGATYIRRAPTPHDPPHTLNLNLKTAIPYIRGNKIIIIEDDEYYAPKYVETMATELEASEIVGIMQAKYYHLPTGGYAQIGNTLHASLAQTGFKSTLIPEVNRLADQQGERYLDMRLWQRAMMEQQAYLFLDSKDSLYVGIKGMPGRKGIGLGHNPSMYGKVRDTQRSILRQWVGQDAQIYLDILAGKLTDENCDTYFPQVTGITVVYNTKELFQRAYESVRKFHPNMPIIIVDGSDKSDPCASYVRSLKSELTTVIQPGYNIGHGNGMCAGIDLVRTPYALIFDSDIEMLKSPVGAMLAMMGTNIFGVGYIEKTGFDGYEFGSKKNHYAEGYMSYLHPYFQLLNIAVYHKFHPYVHHGAPCYLTMKEIHEKGLSDTLLREFPGLGHTAGRGWVWKGEPREWIRHDVRGTRNVRVKSGKPEIEGNWVMRAQQ